MMHIKVCRDCPDRKLKCHVTCEKYLDERSRLEEEKAIVYEHKKRENDLINRSRKGISNMKMRKR